MIELTNPDKPIVFLDIDGVLNSTQFAIDLKNGNREDYEKNGVGDRIDKRAVGFLNEIADWNFVLSSTWRRIKTIEEMNKILKDHGFLGTLIDYTPITNSLRGNEILEWMQKNLTNYHKRDYIIFDDDSDVLYWQKDNFVQIDSYFGLSPNSIHKAKRLLKIY